MLDTQNILHSGRQENSPRFHGSVHYRILMDLHEVAYISSEWDELLAISKCNRAFDCSKWYLATVELLPAMRPLVFTAYRNHTLSGVFPLWLDINNRRARFGDNYRDYLDIIAGDGDLEVIRGLLDLALQDNGDYDHLVLESVKGDSNIVQAAKALGLDDVVEGFFLPDKSLSYAVVDLRCGYEAYMKTLGRKFRLNLHRICNRVRRDGLVVRELKPPDWAPELLAETFLSLHLSRFGDRSDFKSAESWVRNLFPALFAEGRMRVFALLEKGRIVGIDLAAVAKSGMYSYPGGFLPEMKKYEPGKLLIHAAIRQACLEGMDEYDLGWWIQDYKAHWRPARQEVSELRLATNSGLRQNRQDQN